MSLSMGGRPAVGSLGVGAAAGLLVLAGLGGAVQAQAPGDGDAMYAKMWQDNLAACQSTGAPNNPAYRACMNRNGTVFDYPPQKVHIGRIDTPDYQQRWSANSTACGQQARSTASQNPLANEGNLYAECMIGKNTPSYKAFAPGATPAVASAAPPAAAAAPAAAPATASADPAHDAALVRDGQTLEAQRRFGEARAKFQEAAADGYPGASTAYCRTVYELAGTRPPPGAVENCSKAKIASPQAVAAKSGSGYYSNYPTQPYSPYHYGHEYEAAAVQAFDIYGFHTGMTLAEVKAAAGKRLVNAVGRIEITPDDVFNSGLKGGLPGDLAIENIERHENTSGEVSLVITHTDQDQRVGTTFRFCKQARGVLLLYQIHHDIGSDYAVIENTLGKGLVPGMARPSADVFAAMIKRAREKYSEPSFVNDGRVMFWGRLINSPPGNPYAGPQPPHVGDEAVPYLKVDLLDNIKSVFLLTLDDPKLEQPCRERVQEDKAAKAQKRTQSSF